MILCVNLVIACLECFKLLDYWPLAAPTHRFKAPSLDGVRSRAPVY